FGHAESASGIAGLIKTALCLQHGMIPASLHFTQPNPNIDFAGFNLSVATGLQNWPQTRGHAARAGVNSFGFGGTNAHAVLQAPPRGRSAEAAAGISDATGGFNFIVPLSAASAPALNDVAKRHLEALEQGELKHARLEDICFSAGTRRTHHDFRLALVAKD